MYVTSCKHTNGSMIQAVNIKMYVRYKLQTYKCMYVTSSKHTNVCTLQAVNIQMYVRYKQ